MPSFQHALPQNRRTRWGLLVTFWVIVGKLLVGHAALSFWGQGVSYPPIATVFDFAVGLLWIAPRR